MKSIVIRYEKKTNAKKGNNYEKKNINYFDFDNDSEYVAHWVF